MSELSFFAKIMVHFRDYVNDLDWSYIITFTIVAYGVSKIKRTQRMWRWLPKWFPIKFLPIIFGLFYALILIYARGWSFPEVEACFKSLLFAVVFQRLILETFIKIFEGNRREGN